MIVIALSAIVATLSIATAVLVRRLHMISALIDTEPTNGADPVEIVRMTVEQVRRTIGFQDVVVIWMAGCGPISRLAEGALSHLPTTDVRWPVSPVRLCGRRSRRGGEFGWLEELSPARSFAVPLCGDGVRGVAIVPGCRSVALAAAACIAKALASSASPAEDVERAIARDRTSLARDLHDGPLQSLIASGIHLRNSSGESADHARHALEAGVSELRAVIDGLRPPRRITDESRLTTRLSLLAAFVRRQWGVDVDVRVEDPLGHLPPKLRREARQLVREAVVNAAKHAHPSHIVVDVERRSTEVMIVVKDDGSGFPFTGVRTMRDLEAAAEGPKTLLERIAAMNGRLQIESSRTGSRVEIAIPVSG